MKQLQILELSTSENPKNENKLLYFLYMLQKNGLNIEGLYD